MQTTRALSWLNSELIIQSFNDSLPCVRNVLDFPVDDMMDKIELWPSRTLQYFI